MALIRHIAVLANDPFALAEFYKKTFGMNEVGRGKTIVYVSDGYINFGFEVEDLEAVANIAVASGAKAPEGVPRDGRFNEAFILDPVGTRVDLSEAGWAVA
jgi:catechol 2,3-dioxygenase-like lactoylglutathione lyase family enzyme